MRISDWSSDVALPILLIGPSDARLWRADIGAAGLDRAVDAIRLTISAIENGRRVTYPFDAATARQLYTQLFGPVADRLPAIAHLIFEPHGAMLRLPINLLVTSEPGLADYERSEERSVGKEAVSTWKARRQTFNSTNKKT